MLVLLYILIAGMILLCAVGCALLLGLFLPRPWVTLAVGPWVVTTLFFAVECIVPLGRPGILSGVLLTVFSVWLLLELTGQTRYLERIFSPERLTAWKNAYALWKTNEPKSSKRRRGHVSVEPFGWIILVLIGTFTYAALWRYPFPNVDGSSEKLPDLMFITSYLAGDGVPAKDFWCAPYSNIQYYSFQHYAAALMGRAFGLGPGLTYNFAFCLLIALISTTGIGSICTFSKKGWIRSVCSGALLVGGMGVSGVIHLMVRNVTLWNNTRFVGCVQCDGEPLGSWVRLYSSQYPVLQLPGEPLSYLIYLGDYHAPLAGFYLLFVALLVLGEYHLGHARQRYLLLGVLAATLPWSLISNTWSLPLQGLLVGSWICYQAIRRALQREDIFAFLIGGVTSLILLLGYLSRFIPATTSYNTALRLVPDNEHTPPLLLLLFLFPTVVSIIGSFFCPNRTLVWVGLFWLGILIFTEMFYIDDVYSGIYDRFNSSLKWWPWLEAGVICSLAPLLLDYAKRLWLKGIVLLAVAYPCLFALDLAEFWWDCPKIANGVVTGDAHLLADPATSTLYSQLKMLPSGLTIERPEGAAYTNTTIMALMASKPCWLGWLGHEQLWRGYAPEMQQRFDKIMAFYTGNSPDVEWLWANHIKYILWYKNQDEETTRRKLDSLLSGHYDWVETFHVGDRSTGYWVLTDPR